MTCKEIRWQCSRKHFHCAPPIFNNSYQTTSSLMSENLCTMYFCRNRKIVVPFMFSNRVFIIPVSIPWKSMKRWDYQKVIRCHYVITVSSTVVNHYVKLSMWPKRKKKKKVRSRDGMFIRVLSFAYCIFLNRTKIDRKKKVYVCVFRSTFYISSALTRFDILRYSLISKFCLRRL